jgi:hypothetical protein
MADEAEQSDHAECHHQPVAGGEAQQENEHCRGEARCRE